MAEKKQLKDEDLKQVSGGAGGSIITEGDISKYENEYTIPVGKYDGVIGTKYLFRRTDSNTDQWLFGTLSNTYESKLGRKRMHDVYVEDGYGVDANPWSPTCIPTSYYGTLEILGDNFQMYRKG